MLTLYINGLVQDWSDSIGNALDLLQSCTKPSISLFNIKVIYVQCVEVHS